MQSTFQAISLSHKSAPVQIRELIALDDATIRGILLKLKEIFSLTDVLILSTCNRTELYYKHDSDISEALVKLVSLEKGILESKSYLDYFRVIKNENQAIDHLFRVALGLEAQVVGDIQISNQVKRAYQLSVDLDLAGPFLHRLMHTIFFSSKRVVQETSFRDGAASLSYATVELIERITSNTYQPRILLIGMGEIGEGVAKNMVHLPDAKVKIANRTYQKAKGIAEELGFEVIPFEDIRLAMDEADVIVSSIQSATPYLTKDFISQFEISSYKLLVDLSVPRSIEVAVESIPGVVLYNVDAIQSQTSKALDKRLAAIPLVENIIREAILEFYDWKKEMLVSPTINKLKQSLEHIRKEELARYMKSVSEEEFSVMEKLTKSMMQKVLKIPVIQLKNACKRNEAEEMIEIISDLFDLDRVKSKN